MADWHKHFKKYSCLEELFWPGASGLASSPDNPHPLITLVIGENRSTKSVATRTNHCAYLVHRDDPNWLQTRAKIVLTDSDYANVSGALGEIRAYGELIWIGASNLIPRKSGSDFQFSENGNCVNVEVTTAQHGTVRHEIDHGESGYGQVSIGMREVFPFGWPEREVDNVQGEAVSRIASFKQREHQFAEDAINILWLDIKDPVVWPISFGREQFMPVSAFREEVTSGAFWNAFYGKRGTPIFDSLSLQGLPSRVYRMEFDGRFQSDSKVDLVVADMESDLVVLQNPKREKEIPMSLYVKLHCLFGFSLELSWINWPEKGALCSRVDQELSRIRAYEDLLA